MIPIEYIINLGTYLVLKFPILATIRSILRFGFQMIANIRLWTNWQYNAAPSWRAFYSPSEWNLDIHMLSVRVVSLLQIVSCNWNFLTVALLGIYICLPCASHVSVLILIECVSFDDSSINSKSILNSCSLTSASILNFDW